MKISSLKMWFNRIVGEWKQVKKEFNPPPGSSRSMIFADYILCVFKYRISYSEYFEQYKFYGLKACERDQFITRAQAHRLETRLNKGAKDTFWFKDKFLHRFDEFANRDWLSLKDSTLDDFRRFTSQHQKFIVKPVTGSLGQGVRLIHVNSSTDFQLLYSDLTCGNNILEAHITACSEIASFNPDSLNTIRVVTFLDGDRFSVIGSFFRMGLKGSAIDNAHAGGIFATVDVDTGIVKTEGVNSYGDRFILHPGSGKQIVGFQIPKWTEIISVCKDAAQNIPEAKIVGWDVAITKDYSIVIIEGNHMPDFDTMQSPARKGIKKELLDAING